MFLRQKRSESYAQDFRESWGAVALGIAILLGCAEPASARQDTGPQVRDTVPQAREAPIGQVTLRGTVEAVDYVGRTVTIRGQQGIVVTVDVATSVTRFEQVTPESR